jgi:hypothetical protein
MAAGPRNADPIRRPPLRLLLLLPRALDPLLPLPSSLAACRTRGVEEGEGNGRRRGPGMAAL